MKGFLCTDIGKSDKMANKY